MIGYAPIDFDDPLEIPEVSRKREVVAENFEKVPEKKGVKAQPIVTLKEIFSYAGNVPP